MTALAVDLVVTSEAVFVGRRMLFEPEVPS